MARMIPPACSSKTPVGERDLFNRLRDDPDTAGWIVLHSLDIKKHQSKIEGELDMVVLVPGFGILCVEVKGCEVSRRDGKWVYPYETSIEGPFKQVSKAMHSLRDYLVRRDSSLSNLLVFSAVVFTRIDFKEESPEWHPWQYVNRTLFVRRPISATVLDILSRAHAHVKSKTGRFSWYHESNSRPTVSQIRRIVTLIRDDFEYFASPRRDLDQIEQTIRRFTEEQFEALDLLRDNGRVIFKGPAGTGKTVLALEAARRAAADGKSVLMTCYNSLLGDWLKAQAATFSTESGKLRCGTFHSLLLDIAGERPVSHQSSDYWRKELPKRALDCLLDDSRSWPIYDVIIIDEAQDLLEPEYLDVFDLTLTGGLAGGTWAIFGDFERQAIYLSEGRQAAMNGLSDLTSRAPRHANYSLRINCRNAVPIAQTLTLTSGLAPGYRRILHDLEGADVDPLFYDSAATQQELLRRAVSDLSRIFRPGEIVVLSMRGDETSCAGTMSGSVAGCRLAAIRKVQDAQTIPFASIHAFKGLEAAAAIITDIEHLEDERTQALLYVAMSRARIRLYMLMHESCRSSYNRILDAGLISTSGT